MINKKNKFLFSLYSLILMLTFCNVSVYDEIVAIDKQGRAAEISVISHQSNTVVNSPNIILRGNASDNAGIKCIQAISKDITYLAAGTEAWNVILPISVGRNQITLQIISLDNVKSAEMDFVLYRIEEEIAELQIGRRNAAAYVYNNDIYISGGVYCEIIDLENLVIDMHISDSIEIYDPETQTSIPFMTLPEPLFEHSILIHESYIYIFGGCNSFSSKTTSCWRHSLSGGSWESLAPLPSERAFHSSILYNGTAIVGPGANTNSILQYNFPGVDSWTPLTTNGYSGEINYQPELLLQEDNLYMIGGVYQDPWMNRLSDNRMFTLNLLDNNLQECPIRLPQGMKNFMSALYKNYILIAGGDNNGELINTFYGYDLGQGKFITLSALSFQCGYAELFLFNSDFYILGGKRIYFQQDPTPVEFITDLLSSNRISKLSLQFHPLLF